jgi:hypothetical protein
LGSGTIRRSRPALPTRLTPSKITKQGLDILRNLKSLKVIGSDVHYELAWPTAEFWARYEKGEFKK